MGTKKDSLDEHNTSANKKWWIPWVAIGLVVVSLIISIWSVTLSNVSINNVNLEFSYDKLGTIIGIILSAVALVISLYFIILGISVNSIRREIKDDVKNAQKDIEDIKTTAKTVKTDIEDKRKDIDRASKDNKELSIISIYELYSNAIALTQRSYGLINIKRECSIIHHADCKQIEIVKAQFSKEITNLKLEQSRMVCDKRNLDIEDKIQDIMVSSINIIKDLGTEEDDLRRLEEVRQNTKIKLIEYTAKEAYDTLDKKLHPKE